jgi:hypothetical protein
VNRPFTERLGLTNAEFCAEPLLAWIHAEDRQDLKGALDSGDGRVCARIKSQEGDWVPFDFHVKTQDGVASFLGLPHFDSDSTGEPAAANPSPGRTALQETLEAMALISKPRTRE